MPALTESGVTFAASSVACQKRPAAGASTVLAQLDMVLAIAEEGDISPLTPFAMLLTIPLAHSVNASHVFSAAHFKVLPSPFALCTKAFHRFSATHGASGAFMLPLFLSARTISIASS